MGGRMHRLRLFRAGRVSQFGRVSQALALVSGRDYCVPDDVKRIAVPVVAHRLVLESSQYGLSRIAESESFVHDILAEIPAPQ